MNVNNEWFLKRVFAGYVRDFARFRWHTTCTYADLTQASLAHFADLGRSLGYVVKREATEGVRPDLVGTGAGGSNPRDLIWVDPDDRAMVALHVESENNRASLDDCLFSNNKLLDSAEYRDGRLLVAVFGWLSEPDFDSLVGRIKETEGYSGRDLLVIAWVGSSKNTAASARALLWSGNQCQMRIASGRLDDDGYWGVNFGSESPWRRL